MTPCQTFAIFRLRSGRVSIIAYLGTIQDILALDLTYPSHYGIPGTPEEIAAGLESEGKWNTGGAYWIGTTGL